MLRHGDDRGPDFGPARPQPPRRGVRPFWRSLPPRFRRWTLLWARGMLLLVLIGYSSYVARGNWTPDHITTVVQAAVGALLGGFF